MSSYGVHSLVDAIFGLPRSLSPCTSLQRIPYTTCAKHFSRSGKDLSTRYGKRTFILSSSLSWWWLSGCRHIAGQLKCTVVDICQMDEWMITMSCVLEIAAVQRALLRCRHGLSLSIYIYRCMLEG